MICIKEISYMDIHKCFLLDSVTLKLWNIEQWREVISNKNNKPIGLFDDDDDLIGVCVYQKITDEVEISFIAVHPNHQRKGAGKELMNNLLAICEKENVKRIILEVSNKNYNAMDFYEDHGFETISIRKKYYRDGSDAILKEKKM